ncbi:GGDEF domain-containing protein [Pseudoalteromonas sp. 2CM28B]|nr:GGDEF domain-containing protein [Pseudoalteromonas sp. 2CM28B]
MNLALRDSLTQPYNRRAFKSHFHNHIDFSNPYCFALADLDFFKKVNDKYGHDAGDEHVYRFGGEEFTLVVNDDIEVPVITMDKLRIDIQNHQFTYMQSTLNITISIGLVDIDAYEHTHLSEILRLADNYLYLAKNNGRNCVVTG